MLFYKNGLYGFITYFILIIICLNCLISCSPIIKKNNDKYKTSYIVKGQRYYILKSSAGYKQKGISSWYGKPFHGRLAADGKVYNMYEMTAAHKNLPLGTFVKVTNLKNKKTIVVQIRDRGPFKKQRILDLSYKAAHKLGMVKDGLAPVEIKALKKKKKRL